MTGIRDIRNAAAASEAALAPYAILDTPAEAAYDDLALLAAELCAAPVALITLFGTGRQWFKAAIGFPGTETTLSDSLCQHARDADDVLVIPDLSVDPRTRDNIYVADGPYARFYAGAPLRLDDGTFLGTVCVIDFAPRPAGLTDNQRSGLRALGQQVVALLELRRMVNERDAAIALGITENRQLRDNESIMAANEAHWRGLFDGLREGFVIGEVIRDAAGRTIDWRHLEANPAFEQVVGFPLADVLAKTVCELTPDMPRLWIDFVGRVVKNGESAAFGEPVQRAGRSYEGRAFPIGGDQFAAIFLDVTDRLAALQRQQVLIAIGDRLRDLDRIEDMTTLAARLVGEALGACRAGYGRLDAARERIDMQPDWTAPGVVSAAGTHRFADYGDLLNELLAGDPLVIDDILTDPRTAADPQPMQALAIGALVNMPVRERGRTVAVFIVHDDRPRRWTAEEIQFLRDVSDRVEIAVTRLDNEARRRVQTQELSHRLKNTLAMVQAIATQTLKPVAERTLVAIFEQRLGALATAHDVLLGTDWESAPLDHVVGSVVHAAGQEARVTLAGPSVRLSPRAVMSVSLLVHELVTNAIKYGALSVPEGRIAIDWRFEMRAGRQIVTFEWIEHDGPPAAPPRRRGFGSRLINMGLAGTGGVDLDYTPAGLSARMSTPVDDLTTS